MDEYLIPFSKDEYEHIKKVLTSTYNWLKQRCREHHCGNPNILIMDFILDIKATGVLKNRKEFIEIYIRNTDSYNVNLIRGKSFVINCTLIDKFYLRSLNPELIDDICPEYKHIKVCDILSDLGISCIDFKSDYDATFNYN